MKLYYGVIAQQRNNVTCHTTHCLVANSEDAAVSSARKYVLKERSFEDGWVIVFESNHEVPQSIIDMVK